MKNLAHYMLILLLTGLTFWKGVVPAFQIVNTDFSNYYVSSRLVYEGRNIDSLYSNTWFKKEALSLGIVEPGKFSPFPPITALLLVPLATLQPLPAQQVFTIVNLLLISACIWFVRRLTHWSWEQSALLLLLSGWGLINNLRLGQVYILMLLFTLMAYAESLKGRSGLPGILIALSSSLKYFTAAYLPAFWLGGQKRVVYASLLGITLLAGGQYLFFGGELMRSYFTHALWPHLNGHLEGQGIFHFSFQSWESLLQFIFVSDPQYNPQPVLEWQAGIYWVKSLILVALTGSMVIGAVAIRKFTSGYQKEWFICLMGFGGMTLLPASATYHFIMLVFPVMLYLTIPSTQPIFRKGILLCYIAIGFIPYSLTGWLGVHVGIFFGFPRLWGILVLYFLFLVSVQQEYGKRTTRKLSYDAR